jgi:hypothetical protein
VEEVPAARNTDDATSRQRFPIKTKKRNN